MYDISKQNLRRTLYKLYPLDIQKNFTYKRDQKLCNPFTNIK